MLEIRAVTSKYDGQVVLEDLSLVCAEGEILCLLGASGSGKTTLLRLIAGIEANYTGTIQFNEEDVHHKPIHKRRFGFMFQDHALFPHLNVADNIAFGLKMQNKSLAERNKRVQMLLELVNLDNYGNRDVASLSGGEKQRVALARSLAPSPRLLMLDEPLASLDANLRQHILEDLHRIIREFNLTTIYVTHDQTEAFALADRIAVLHQGRIAQVSTPHELYWRPTTQTVARFIGLTNIFETNRFPMLFNTPVPVNSPYYLIHPMGIELSDTPQANTATIQESRFQGELHHLTVMTTEQIQLQFSIAQYSQFQVGDTISIAIKPQAIVPLEA